MNSNMMVRMSDNSLRKPHQCDNCSKSFSSSHQLAQHSRTHTGEKPYKCSYCERSFKQLSHVQQHTRLHTGERPYKCPSIDCGRSFIQLSNLQQHMRTHMSTADKIEKDQREKLHYCNICRKGFKAQANLITHKCKKHPGIDRVLENQVCPICNITCASKEVLLDHLRTIHHDYALDSHSKKKYIISNSCPVCGKNYINEGSLRKHITSTHPEAFDVPVQVAPASSGFITCCVCKNVFTSEAGLLAHMEQMRTDPRHQFEAQIVLSCAAAEKRAREAAMAQTLVAHQLLTQTAGHTTTVELHPTRVTNGTLISINLKPNHELNNLSQV